MQTRYDVIVVGAGPAGSSAAFHLTSHGFDVLLVDKQQFPREKVCGDALSPRGVRALERMGLADFVANQAHIRGHRFVQQRRGIRTLLEREFGPCEFGAVIPRHRLDDELRRRAVTSGARFLGATMARELSYDARGHVEGVLVERDERREPLRSRCVVLADGAAGLLGKQLRLSTPGEWAPRTVAIRQYWKHVRDLTPFFEIHVPLTWREKTLVGYAWIFPVSDDVANVGLGFIRGSAARVPSLGSLLGDFTGYLRDRDARFSRAFPCGSAGAGVIATGIVDAKGAPDGVVLVGDSAHLVNPLTGEGIAYAIESGEFAADSVAVRLQRRQRSVAIRYSRKLLAAYPRHHAIRHSLWYLRWLAAHGLPRAREGTSVVAALSSFVGDQAPRRATDLPLLPKGHAGHAIRRSVDRTHGHVVNAVRRVDSMLGQLLEYIVADPPWGAVIPVIVAHAIAAGRRSSRLRVDDAIASATLFTLSHALLDEVEDGPQREKHPSNTVAILLGDCLAAEGITALRRWPRQFSRPLLRSLTEAARVRIPPSTTWPSSTTSAARCAALAAPAVALADYVAFVLRLGAPERAQAIAFARWYAVTAIALMEARREPAPATVAVLRRQILRECRQLSTATRELCAHLTVCGTRLVGEVAEVRRPQCAAP